MKDIRYTINRKNEKGYWNSFYLEGREDYL